MNKENFITDYIVNYDLDIEKMIKDFKDYILHIVNNNSRGILTHEDKEEIVSDVFLSIWHNKEKIDSTKPLKNYIAGITKNLIKTKFKKINKLKDEVHIDTEETIDLKDVELVFEQEQISKAIAEELHNMKKTEYEVFCKYYYFSKSIKEISNEMKNSESNVKVKLHRIRKKLKSNLVKRGINFKALSIILILSMVTGVVFAKEILEFISNIFINTSEGVGTAIENGYIQDVDMDYEKNNGAEVKVDYVLMDDFNLNIMFNINLQEDNPKIKKVEFSNLIITDENDNILVAEFESNNKYEQFCKARNIEVTHNNIACGNTTQNLAMYDSQDSNYKCSYSAVSNGYPKSKKLNISFDKIVLLDLNRETLETKSGKWNIEIDLDEKIYKRETIIYNLDYCNDSNLELISATVSETGMKIRCKTIWGEPIYNDYDSKEERKRKTKEFYSKSPRIEDLLIKDSYVLNSNGKKFYPARSNDSDGGYGQRPNGILECWQTFNLTTSNATDNITVVLIKGGEWKKEEGEEIIIKLSRKGE